MKRRFTRSCIHILLIITVVLFAMTITSDDSDNNRGNIYYVDFDRGSDSNPGNTRASAWKHAPGDPNATLVPAGKVLLPGDTVQFKGGVTYRGSVRMNFSGSAAGNISYEGSSWGNKPAILSGADPAEVVWTKCTSAAQVNGNPNYSRIYYAKLPEKQDVFSTIHQGDIMFYLSQYPKQPDPFAYNNKDYFISRALPDPRYEVTLSSIRDDDYFTQPDGYWENAYVTLWVYANVCVTRKVTSYNSATHTITFEPITGNTLYPDVLKYAMLNNAAFIDSAGKYFYNAATNTLYVWPVNSNFSTPITVAKRDRAFNINGKSYLTIDGFAVKEYVGLLGENYKGVALYSLNTAVRNVTFKNNRIYNMRSMEGSGVIDFTYGDSIQLLNNEITGVQGASGISAVLQNSVISGNTIDKTGRSGIRLLGTADYPSTNVQILNNRIKNIFDIHGNGITMYNNNLHCLVAYNRVTDASRPMTIQGYNTPATDHNIVIYSNLFIANGDNAISALTDWGNQLNNVKILNNILESTGPIALTLHYQANNVIVKNNIIGGFAITGIGINNPETDCRSLAKKGWEFTNNAYTSYSWMQTKAAYSWSLGTGEIKSTEALLFTNPANGDYTPAEGSPAIDAGVDVTALIGSGFAGFDLYRDMLGAKRPMGNWDMGCYEKQK